MIKDKISWFQMQYPLLLWQIYMYFYWAYEWIPDKWKKTVMLRKIHVSMFVKFSVAFEAIVQQCCTARIILHLTSFLQFLYYLFHIHLSQWCKLLPSSYKQKYKNLRSGLFSLKIFQNYWRKKHVMVDKVQQVVLRVCGKTGRKYV